MASAVVVTVRGPVSAASLGVTDIHEHLVARPEPHLVRHEEDLQLDQPERIVADLQAFRAAGGGCVVEMTTRDYGQDPAGVARLAVQTGLHIVQATGFNKAVYCRRFCEAAGEWDVNRHINRLADQQIRDVLEGIDGSGVRAGLHKFATGIGRMEPWEAMAARAAARAHRVTGAPILTHTEAGTLAAEQLDLLAEEGVAPDAVVLGHMDRNPDLALHRALLARGAFLSYDQIPKPKYATEGPVLDLLVALARQGLHRGVVLGGDLARRSNFKGWGGEPGLTYLVTEFRRRLSRALDAAGLDPGPVLEDLYVNNPARALALRKGE